MPIVLRPPSDKPPLPNRLAALGRARRRVSIAAGAFALVGAVVGVVLVACGLDAWLHLPPLARAFALVAALAAGGVVWLRAIGPGFRLPTEPLAVALELEGRFPRLNDSLASAVSFLDDRYRDEDLGVSRRLRVAAVRRAERMAERHDFDRLVPFGLCWRLFWMCAVVVGVAVPIGLWDTTRTATAAVRLADPFGTHPWPAKTRIDIVTPHQLPGRIPKGDAFELQFVVRGVIPERAAVTFRVAGGDEFEEVYPLAKADPKNPTALPPGVTANGPVAVIGAKLDPNRLSHDFQFRIRANDADTSWLSVAVVPPPRLIPLDGRASPQLRVVPPLYTGMPPLELPDGAAVVEVPVGTVVSIRAAADTRLAGAVLAYLGDRSTVERTAGLAPVGLLNPIGGLGAQLLAEGIGADVPLTLSGDGKVMSGTFTPSVSGMYALRLTDETGLCGTRLIELRLTPDPAPGVSLLRPAAGRDPPVVVPEASITVHVAAEDKVYALRTAALEYRVGREGPVRTIPLPDATAAVTGAAGRLHPARYESVVVLPVASFLRGDGTPVRDGDVIVLRAAADDWDDVSVLKEPGRSGEVEIRVATREAIEAFLQKELAGLRPDLLRAREHQRDAAQKTADTKPQPDGTLAPADREKLFAAEQLQRQTRGRVADPRDGLRARAEMLRELTRVNKLPKSNTTDRVEAVADELARLPDRLDAIESQLGEARQQAGQPPKAGQEKAVPRLLTQAGRQQKAVEDGLTILLDLLSQWGGAGEIRGDARMLRDGVLREAGVADKMPDKVPPGKAPDTLATEQRGELDRAAGKLDQLADQANGLLGRAARLAAEKRKQAAEAGAAADAKEKEAEDLRKKAAALPPGTPDRNTLERKAATLKDEAAETRSAGTRATAEAEALERGVKEAGGQALPDDLRKAAEAMRNDRQAEAAALDRSAAARLDRLAGSLTEQPADTIPELAKKRAKAANEFDELAGEQDDLRKRAEEAGRIKDAEKRADELKRLAPEQQKLIDQTRDLVQRLTRERADEAAKDARAALDKMESARDDLERGDDPATAQKDATGKLDAARDKLDSAVAKAPRELTDEKRRKLFNQVKALLDRQAAAVAEADRIQVKVLAEKKWPRPLLMSTVDLEDRERALSTEIRVLADREFADLPVFARVVQDAADAAEKAADKIKARRQDALDADPDAAFDPDLEKTNNARVRRPMSLAVLRLEQILDALKTDDPTAKKDEKKDGPTPEAGPTPPQPSPGGTGDVIPPLAQIKALRALQADLNQRTAEFAKSHPDPDKFADEDREDLKELEQAQREITALFEKMAQLFRQKDVPPEANPPQEKP
ncbi:MAG: hypothetical protein JWO38_4534 [Gemmataceae bacterium]|nr:hypothetical protein [Gemmataceae bacterium]